MLRDELLYALYEEITANYTSLAAVLDSIEYSKMCDYLTLDESDCLYEMLENWYEC